MEELKKTGTVGWLRNVDRQQWSLEIPFESGGEFHSMFPDLLIVRQDKSDYTFDILEPHDPSLADNFEKAIGLAKFAENYGHLFGKIELIRAETLPGGKQRFLHLDLNRSAVKKKVFLITSNPQLNAIFESDAT